VLPSRALRWPTMQVLVSKLELLESVLMQKNASEAQLR
jgi:hypothetical protein